MIYRAYYLDGATLKKFRRPQLNGQTLGEVCNLVEKYRYAKGNKGKEIIILHYLASYTTTISKIIKL